MRFFAALATVVILLTFVVAAHAQSQPGWTTGYVPSAAQWNAEFGSKRDYNPAIPACTWSPCQPAVTLAPGVLMYQSGTLSFSSTLPTGLTLPDANLTGTTTVNQLSLTTPLGVASGGTGLSSLPTNAVLLGSNTAPINFSSPGTSGGAFLSQGTSSNPAFEPITGDLSLAATGLATVTGLQGYPVGSAAPSTSQAPVWNGSEYVPTTVVTGTTVSITPATSNIVLTPNPLLSTGTVGTTNSIVQLGGTTGSILLSYNTQEVELTNPSLSAAISIATAGSSGFASGFSTPVCALAQPSTVTPVSGTINGDAAFPLLPYQCADLRSNGSQYLASLSYVQPAGPSVANLAALRKSCTGYSGCPAGDQVFPNGVIRVTDGVAGAPQLQFSDGSGACATDDGASCVNSADGNQFDGVFPNGQADVRQWGAVTTGATDVTTAVQNALTYGPPVIMMPAGTFSLSALTMARNGQRIQCTAPRATTLAQNSTSGNLITMTGEWDKVDGCFFEPTVRVTGEQVLVAAGCYHCAVTNFEMAYVFDGITDQTGAATIGGYDSNNIIGSIYGTFAILFQGTSSTAQASGLTLSNVLVNNAWPINSGNGNEVVAWAVSTNYVAGDITHVNAALYQEATSTCTSASSGSGPTGFPSGTSPFNIFSGSIADGTCNWRFVSNDLIGLVDNSWGNSATVNDFSVLNNYECIKLLDNNNPGTLSAPHYAYFKRPQCDHNYLAGIDMEAGYDTEIYAPYVGSVFTNSGIIFGGTYDAIGKVIGGRVADNWQDGIVMAVGSNFTIQGVDAGSNSQQGSGIHNNIEVEANINGFNINNNMVGKDPEAANAYAYAGVLVDTGTSNYYTITNNLCQGNVTHACVADGGSGTSKTITPNW